MVKVEGAENRRFQLQVLVRDVGTSGVLVQQPHGSFVDDKTEAGSPVH